MTSISKIINDTNFVKINSLGVSNLFLKLEALNPAGSIKMKAALGMIEDLEARGKIGTNSILVESSSGSLGVAISIICAERGYKFLCVVDPNTTHHNIKMMKALGAEIVVIDQRDENGGFLGKRISFIKELLLKDERYLWLNQYANPENPRAHARTTARAIYERFEHIDYLFVGAGTTGTLMGCLQFFKQYSPNTKIIAVDSIGSVTFGFPAGRRHIPGLGTSRRPEIFMPDGIHALEMIGESDTIAMCRYLARTNGVFGGGSTGTVLAAVHKWRSTIPEGAMVVTISPDSGERYLDTVYDDDWVIDRFGCIPSITAAHDAPETILAADQLQRIPKQKEHRV